MTCTQMRHAISARLDGEDPGLDDATVYRHLAGCADCRAFSHDAESLHRRLRLSPAPAIPDLAPGILAAIGEEARVGPDADASHALRWILVAIAIAQIAIAIPALVLGTDAGLPAHTARATSARSTSRSVSGSSTRRGSPRASPVSCRWSPRWSPAWSVRRCSTSRSGNTAALGEVQHGLEVVGLVVVWLLRPAREPRPLRLAS